MAEDKIAEFVRRKRKVQTQTVEIKEVKTPWYRRPIEREAFSIREGKDGKFSEDAVNKVIDSYVEESLKGSLDKKPTNSIHSVIIEDGEEI